MASVADIETSNRLNAQTILDARISALAANTELVFRRVTSKLSISPVSKTVHDT